jgi:signal transduction histidine kinase
MSGKLDTASLRDRLHDGLCQQLTGALMFSRVLSEALQKRNDPLANDAETLFKMISDAADEVHTLMSDATKKS